MAAADKTTLVLLTLLVLLTVVLGLGTVWLNIERLDLAYDLRVMEQELDETESLIAKLEVERNNLVSPYRLQGLAKRFGLGPVQPGQVRRMGPEAHGASDMDTEPQDG